MSRIKSAWEIALEKTADIEIDEKKFKQDSLQKAGMALAGSFLNDPQQEVSQIITKLSSYSKEELATVKDGLKRIVLSNITLPVDDSYEFRLSRVSQLAAVLNPAVQETFSQMSAFFQQYMTARMEFVKRMEEQIKQMMESNPQQANPEQYSKLIEQNLKKMEDQYSQALASTVEGLKEML